MTKHALVIDDNRLNIDVLTVLLNNEGLSSTAVDTPRVLLETLHSLERVDVVFLDLEFPNDDGFNLLAELQEVPLLKGIPIVAYTVHTSEINAARRAGFHSFLGKPVDMHRFPELLKRILNGQHVWEM